MSRIVVASAAGNPPLSGIDEVSIAKNAVLIFSHPSIKNNLYIHSGATSIKWAYHLNTQSLPTIGGEVIQVLSATVGPMTISGQTAGLATSISGRIDESKQVSGWRNVGTRVAFSPYQELREIIAWFRSYMTMAGALTSGQQTRDEAAVLFTYPERGWKFYIQITKLDGFHYDREIISPEWSITAEIVSDSALDYFGGVTMGSFTDDLVTNQQLLGQMGLSAFGNTGTETANPNFGQDGDFGSNNPFLNPAFSASGVDAAKLMGDNFKGLVAAWSTGNFANFGFGALLDNGFNQAQVDSTYQSLFGTTFSGAAAGVGTSTTGTATYTGPANPTTKNQIVLDINTSFESKNIPGKVGVAVAMIESDLNPDRTQDSCTSPNCGIGLFQTNGDASGAGGNYSPDMIKKAGAQRVYESTQGNIMSAYPTGQQISDAASWFSATQIKDYPAGLDSTDNEQLAEFAQKAQGSSDPNYITKVIAALPQAQAAINTAGGAAGTGGTLAGIRLTVTQWATKIVSQYESAGSPTYSESGRRDMENITPADWNSVPLLDCSSSIALCYAWGTRNNHAYGLNFGSFNGVTTRTIWATWATSQINEQTARVGDIIVYSPDANDASNTLSGLDPTNSQTFNKAAYNSTHAEMFMEDFNGDSTLVFSFGANPPTIAAFSLCENRRSLQSLQGSTVMAISSTYTKAPIIGSVASATTGSSQPPAFRATGKGWFNRLPSFPATAANANASMINKATSETAKSYKIYLFVNSIQTGYTLAGETAQGPMGRVFYPRNLTQDEVVVEGIVANQYEYDRLATFVEFHHRTQMLPQTVVPPNLFGDSSYVGIDFRLFKPMGGHPLDIFKPIRWLLLVTDIASGHERFINYPTFSLQCKVVYDYLGTNEEIDQQINSIITRQQIFGAATNPVASTGNSPLATPPIPHGV